MENEQKKIIRVFFTALGDEFCVDRPVDPAKNDQENSDATITQLVESMGKRTIVPALRLYWQDEASDTEGTKRVQKAEPVIINLGNIPVLTVKNVGTYVTDGKKPENGE